VHERPVEDLIDEFQRLPGVGRKTAERYVFLLLSADETDVRRFAEAMLHMKERIGFCSRCHNIAEGELCRVCANPQRDAGVICVVETPRDVASLERTQQFRGLYHVLGGALSPIDGITPERLTIASLVDRVRSEDVREVILCTNQTVDGDATASYLARELAAVAEAGTDGPTITRIASGLPVGSDLDFADDATLTRALAGRRSI
jgi:recombination protein RecR